MRGIGNIIQHVRYGRCKVTHSWTKLIDPGDRSRTTLAGLTFEILTKVGRELFRRDRNTLYLNDAPLPRCYENNLKKMKVIEHAKY